MLANKVSPASLCSNTTAGNPEMNLTGHGLPVGSGGGDESQHSQASLFNSGGSELANSMELFSQPYSVSSHSSISQHSQNHSTTHHNGPQNSQDDIRGIQNVQLDHISGKDQSQTSRGHNKYYMRYLSTASLSSKLHKKQQDSAYSTPLAAEGRQGDTAHSKAAFDAWQSKLQERAERHKLIEEVISSTSGYAKELNHTLETLRKDIKEALCSPTTNGTEKSQTEEVTHSALREMAQGQVEIKEQLSHLKILCSQQNMEISALKSQVSTLERTQATAIQSTLSNEMTRLEKSLLKPRLHDLGVQVSQLSEQLKSYSQMPVVEEDNSGLGDTRERQHHTPTPCAATNNPHPGNRGMSAQDRSQPRRVQIKRKRKSSSATRDTPSERLSDKSRGGHDHSKPEGSVGGEAESALSQSSTEDLSTPCDVDLTQHSPSGCSQIISQNVQKLKHYNTSTSQTVPQQMGMRQPQQATSISPSRGPGTKRKRVTGRVSRQRAISFTGTNHKRKVMATPRVMRRSQRLRKPFLNATPVKLAQEEKVVGKEYSRDEGECVDHTRATSMDRQSAVQGSNSSGGGDGSSGRDCDVLEDWLDFQPPQVTPQSADIKPASLTSKTGDHGRRFQRSSEAARRRLVVTEQMSSTLAGSDSVLRELFRSVPSILSP